MKRYPFWLMPPLFIGALGVVLWFLEPVHAGDNLERRRTQALETIAQTLKNRDTKCGNVIGCWEGGTSVPCPAADKLKQWIIDGDGSRVSTHEEP